MACEDFSVLPGSRELGMAALSYHRPIVAQSPSWQQRCRCARSLRCVTATQQRVGGRVLARGGGAVLAGGILLLPLPLDAPLLARPARLRAADDRRGAGLRPS